MPERRPTLTDRVTNAMALALIGLARLLPYPQRVPFVGWLVSRLIAPVAGWNRRIRANLALIFPDLSPTEVRRITRKVTDNAARALIETYSPRDFRMAAGDAPLTGPGVDALLEACDNRRAVLLVSGHIGNYDAIAVAMERRGHHMGVLYRPMKNPLFNAHYVEALSHFARPPLATDRRGITQMVRQLREGGLVAMNHDVRRAAGTALTFLGRPAMTSTTPAEWAMKYDALLVPIYGIRQPDGFSFEIVVETPVPLTGDLPVMTQALNDALERQVRAHPDQWFWVHDRWKDAR